MDASPLAVPTRPLAFKQGLFWAALAIASFHLAYSITACAFLFVVHLFCLIQLSRVRTNRIAMRFGMGIGPLLYGPHLFFFWTVFGPTAIALWLVLAFWIAIFLVLLRSVRERFGEGLACLAAPVLWTGLEYFRSELYYLRFSWLNAGYAFAGSPALPVMKILGLYGVGFALMTLAAASAFLWRRRIERGEIPQDFRRTLRAEMPASDPLSSSEEERVGERRPFPSGSVTVKERAGDERSTFDAQRSTLNDQWAARVMSGSALWILLIALCVVTNLPYHTSTRANPDGNTVQIAGMQLEFPGELEVVQALNTLHQIHPNAALLVLSEYTFSDGPVPARVRAWCRSNQVYVAAGGKDELPDGRYYNSIFVIGPQGDILFKQAKKQPIQFFKDGEPASTQRVWNSPWGRLGICICYDLSYTRVVDELVRQGAQAIIVPTMDVAEWGGPQHRLHARVAPVRAAEYGLQLFRLASSGISQWVDELGRVRASAPFPGEGSILAAELRLAHRASRPLDRWLAPASTALTGLIAMGFLVSSLLRILTRRALPSSSHSKTAG